MTRLILVRHGQTDWNNINRLQGKIDVPLNAKGLKQAQDMAAQLGGEKINAIFSSKLLRSFATAEKIAKPHKLKVKKVKELNELDQGLWQGLLLSDVKKRYKKQYNLWKSDPTLVQPPKGEDIKEVFGSVSNFMKKVIDKFTNKTVCIVSHEIITGLIKCYIKGLSPKDMWEHTLKLTSWEVIESGKR
ncbi:MAG: histidine phosphatase family protein [Candidatus Omnitrophica bacterium CG07_land_8_20_14_0_80_42_15]|uniref:Histidine phosphatase family protein n=1 Tax=Candidatus Aquitaenariimonas noxiae TaxID=1974741 RepID=A0A2J0KV03_9BACT|nr:MAG: histidine phosphatase family protein [Candidatus Omnitrophica bacterium CG07_land_8_20_14_0_80_42_15]